MNGYFLSTPGRTDGSINRCPRVEDNKFVLLWSLHNTTGALIGRPHEAGYRILLSSNDIPMVSRSVNARSEWLPLEIWDVLRHELSVHLLHTLSIRIFWKDLSSSMLVECYDIWVSENDYANNNLKLFSCHFILKNVKSNKTIYYLTLQKINVFI